MVLSSYFDFAADYSYGFFASKIFYFKYIGFFLLFFVFAIDLRLIKTVCFFLFIYNRNIWYFFYQVSIFVFTLSLFFISFINSCLYYLFNEVTMVILLNIILLFVFCIILFFINFFSFYYQLNSTVNIVTIFQHY